MGWLFKHGASRADIINGCIRPEETEQARWTTLAHCTKGNVLWVVYEVFKKQQNETKRFIGCILIAPQKNFGWGYKDMSESMGPCYYSCPLSYLGMAPETDANWRQRVREWHARMSRTVAIGDVWSLPNCSPSQVTITSVRPLWGEHAGMVYRLSRKRLGERLAQSTKPQSGKASRGTAAPAPSASN
jgi:hypothetical protein